MTRTEKGERMGLQERLNEIEKHLSVLNERTEILRDHFNKSNELLYKNERGLKRNEDKLLAFIQKVGNVTRAVEVPEVVAEFLKDEHNIKIIEDLIHARLNPDDNDEYEDDETEEDEEDDEMDLDEVKKDLVKINAMLEKIDKYLC